MENRFELICGVTIAVLAALLAINDLGGGKFGGDEIAARSEGERAYSWYASKGLKENLAEGQRESLSALLAAGVIAPDKAQAVEGTIHKLDAEISRYGREKKEILLGSAAVGRENWVQEVDGELGRIKGAKEWDKKLKDLESAADVFDTATLFLQLCLVFGAVSLIMKSHSRQKTFFILMLTIGLVGAGFSVKAFWMAFAA